MDKNLIKRAVLDVLRATAVALIVNVLFVLVIAVIVKYTGIDASTATAINQIVKVLSIAVGSIVGIRGKRYGLAIGAVVGVLFTTVGFAVFSLLAGSSLFDGVTVFDYLIGIGAGIFSGILAVNLRSIERTGRSERISKRRKATHAGV